MNGAELGARIRRLRLASGLGQVEFAALLNIGSGSISMIENGRTPVAEDLLQSIGNVLGCSVDFLRKPDRSPLVSQPLLRAYADAPKKAVDRQVADASIVTEVSERLGLKAIPDALPTWAGDLADEADIEQFAADVRVAAQVEEGAVVGNVIRAAERLGCLVLPMPDELGRHLGMSTRLDSTPVICVSRASAETDRRVPGDRQRFTVAHELGHLGMHGHLGPPQSAQEAAIVERQAHYFAGAFLLPGDALLEELSSAGGRVTLQTLASLKERWGVAIKALVMRLRNLEVIDADHARSLYKQISARGWNKSEPVVVGPESAIWLERALAKRFAGQSNPLLAAAREAGLETAHFQRWTDWTPTATEERIAQVLEMRPRSATRARVPRRDGVVHLQDSDE
ncbi:Zn-dependent peptidase ImmA, M78 family [Blastococcus aurantiacus]|uniref:Zn-dependent peptidase ImmA, M78 family n=1 Tax=Blastococcus aurantiacus TaxID=1550231 RepID=A0A1G7JX60_9ACTN|nr:XRE family transcriptional regulator [Blastococcus aurantiacus]SDF29394.1 Zn-dependent peptidase ImmA, M78 family [Blastococcus aurantiacus]